MGPTGPRGGIDRNEGETRVTLWDKYLFHGKYHPHILQFRLFEGDTTRHAGYGQSLRRRKLVEEVFGCARRLVHDELHLGRGCMRIYASPVRVGSCVS